MKTKMTIAILSMLVVLSFCGSTFAGDIIYVDADATGTGTGLSWANAYKFLQDGLAIADANDEIRVAQGIYTPDSSSSNPSGTGDRGATFQLINGVALKGGYAGFGEPDPNARDIKVYETVLSGDLNGDDGPDFANNDENSYHIVTGSGTDETAVLDGFTITAGNANGQSHPLYQNDGGGMYNSGYPDNPGSPTVSNCTFSGNSASNGGGGMCNKWNSSPRVTGCTFTGNSANQGGGMSDSYNCNSTLVNCIFIGNSANNHGGGMYTYDSSQTLINCLFSDNSALYGGGMGYSDIQEMKLINCIFSGNSANYGGGMHSWYFCAKVYLYNCSFSKNSANYFGGAICNDEEYGITRKMDLINCILWGNNDSSSLGEFSQIYPSDYELSVSYCDIQGGWQGLGNIDVDPLFVDPCNGDYHLKSEGWRWSKYIVHGSHWWCDYVTSPCIDAGNPGSPLGNELLTIPDDPYHLWGENLRINMGAYGGTAQASMPPYGWALLGDLSNDGIVGDEDLAGQIEDWLATASQQPGDLNRDGIVNMADFALLAQDWLQMTDWYEPPIVLEIYALGCWGVYLLDTITMPEEGEITITSELPPQSSYAFVYAFRERYYTEIYNLDESNTINVDLDPIVPTKFNGTIFLTDPFFTALYLADTDVNVIDGDTVVGQFRTDEQGRFAIEMEPGNYYFEFYECASGFGGYHREEVEIQGQYKDFFFHYDSMVDKPNIYLYPEETIEVDVNIVFPHGGRLRTSIPEYGDGWHITVEPSGIIDGQYECLFYESLQPDYGQYAAGWVVIREQLEDFFRNNMGQTGFNQKEIDDFIEYWIPILTEYPYYAIYPQYKGELEEMIKLEFSAQPESLIRLIYSVRGLEDNNLNIQEPVIPPFTRDGFTVTEWGVILK